MQLQNAFFIISIFRHFDFFKFLKIKTNASNKAIEIIFCQFDEKDHWHSIIYFLKKMISTKCNYEIYDKKLLTIIKIFKQWRHYLKNVNYKVLMLTNYKNLNRFMLMIKFLFRQIRWIQKLFKYYFIINYQFDNKNSTNELFRRSNYMIIT